MKRKGQVVGLAAITRVALAGAPGGPASDTPICYGKFLSLGIYDLCTGV